MNRWLSVIVAVAASALAGCNPPKCGPGTAQRQNKNGTVDCVPADVMQGAGIPCDADGGATVQGGFCVSAITCGEGTTLMNGKCVSTGGGPTGCSTPAPGKACVTGSLIDLVTNVKSTATVSVALVDPLTFLSGGGAIATQNVAGTGAYKFQDFTPPQLGLIAIIVSDPGTSGTPMYYTTATGDQQITGNTIYTVDAYVLEKSVVDGWKAQFDVDTLGGYLAKFYNDPKPLNTNLTATETHPVGGVQLTQDTNVVAAAKYFGTSLTTIDGAATSTNPMTGAVIAPAPDTSGGFPNFSGMGGSITWETQPGASKPGVVFITRFHPNM